MKMKKILLVTGIVLLIIGALCLLAALFFHHMHRSVLDGSASLYARLYRRFLIHLRLGLGLAGAGALSIVISVLMKTR